MSTIYRQLVDLLSLTLKPDEREAVRGDLEESGETRFEALFGLFGLALRRNWRPWTVLTAALVPLSVWLGIHSHETADGSAVFVWLYANNWDWSFLTNAAFRHDLVTYSGMVFLDYLKLAIWSSLGGCLLGVLSRRGLSITGAAFCALALTGETVGATTARDFGNNAAVFSLAFYRMAFPLLVLTGCVLVPSLWAMRKSPRLLGLLLAVTSLALAADQPAARAVVQPVHQRKPAPEFNLTDGNGKTVNLKQYRGKVVLLDFWATWCHGCKQEIPWFAEFHRLYAAKGLSVVGVSLDGDGWKVVKPFLAGTDVPYRIVLGNDAVAKEYGIDNMPDTYLIDRQGRIAATYNGMVDRENIAANIRAMLAQP